MQQFIECHICPFSPLLLPILSLSFSFSASALLSHSFCSFLLLTRSSISCFKSTACALTQFSLTQSTRQSCGNFLRNSLAFLSSFFHANFAQYLFGVLHAFTSQSPQPPLFLPLLLLLFESPPSLIFRSHLAASFHFSAET